MTAPAGRLRRIVWWATFLALATAAVLAAHVHPLAALLAMIAVLPAWLAIAERDLREHLVPDPLSWGSVAVLLVGFGIAAVQLGQPDELLRACLAAAVFGLSSGVLALVTSLGWGDVKLSLSLGLALGWQGWPVLLAGAGLALTAGALWAAVLLARGRERSAHIPLGPCWIIGTVAGVALTGLIPGV